MLTFAFDLLHSEDKPNEQIKKQLEQIQKQSHAKVKIPLAVFEAIYRKTKTSASIGRNISFKTENGWKTLSLAEIIEYRHEISLNLVKIQDLIMRKYEFMTTLREETSESKNLSKELEALDKGRN